MRFEREGQVVRRPLEACMVWTGTRLESPAAIAGLSDTPMRRTVVGLAVLLALVAAACMVAFHAELVSPDTSGLEAGTGVQPREHSEKPATDEDRESLPVGVSAAVSVRVELEHHELGIPAGQLSLIATSPTGSRQVHDVPSAGFMLGLPGSTSFPQTLLVRNWLGDPVSLPATLRSGQAVVSIRLKLSQVRIQFTQSSEVSSARLYIARITGQRSRARELFADPTPDGAFVTLEPRDLRNNIVAWVRGYVPSIVSPRREHGFPWCLEELKFNMQEGVTVKGRILDQEGKGVSNQSVMVRSLTKTQSGGETAYLSWDPGSSRVVGGIWEKTVSRRDGSFQFSGLSMHVAAFKIFVSGPRQQTSPSRGNLWRPDANPFTVELRVK
jgi:hypothetical protein